MKFLAYLQLFKFRYHITFISVIIGVFAFADKPLYTLLPALGILYISFNVLLYGGLYTLNDIGDIESASRHPQKKKRPLPSKKISIASAYIFALSCIASALITSLCYFGTTIFVIYISFILINLSYTFIAKKIPYVELIVNSLTHSMRFLLGVFMVTAQRSYFPVPYFLFSAIFLTAFGFACVRRIIELRADGWETRPVLRYYTSTTLTIFQICAFILIIIISSLDSPSHYTWYGMIIALYSIFVFGIYFSHCIRNFFKWAWLN